jgi:hypothetical protein
MENIYCSSCESVRIFEPKKNGKDLLQQLRIGKDFRAEEIKEKAILADSHRQGFWAEELWKRSVAAAGNRSGFLSWRNKGESWSCRCVSARILSRRTMERELLQQQWIGKDSEFEKQWRAASSSYHKIGNGFELKKQWSDVSKTFLSIGKDLAQRSRRILEQISVTEMMILKKFAIMKRSI